MFEFLLVNFFLYFFNIHLQVSNFSEDPLKYSYSLLVYSDKNFKYDWDKLNKGNFTILSPEKFEKIKKGLCEDFTYYFIYKLQKKGITPYYLWIKYNNEYYFHSAAMVKYKNKYYVLDQKLPFLDLENYIKYKHKYYGKNFKKIICYMMIGNNKIPIFLKNKFNYSIKLNKSRILSRLLKCFNFSSPKYLKLNYYEKGIAFIIQNGYNPCNYLEIRTGIDLKKYNIHKLEVNENEIIVS